MGGPCTNAAGSLRWRDSPTGIAAFSDAEVAAYGPFSTPRGVHSGTEPQGAACYPSSSPFSPRSPTTANTRDSMPHVPLLETEKAPQEVKAIYEEFHRRMSFPSAAQFHHDARPLSHRGAGNVGGGAECPGQRGNSPLDEGDDVCRHLEGSSDAGIARRPTLPVAACWG